MTDHRRYTKADGYVWCHYHGEIHPADENYYGEDGEGENCHPRNWAPVYTREVVQQHVSMAVLPTATRTRSRK